MATLVNIRIHTQSKAVPNAGYIAIDKVMMEGNTIVAMGGDVRYVLGVVPMENIVVETPSNSTECGCNTTNANIFATLIKGVDGVTPDMSDYYDKGQVDEKLSTKQDAISDLATIRSGASKGATALQSVPSNYITERELQERHYATTKELESKQDVISDLDAIREGASKGATAVQPVSLANYVSKDDVDAEMSSTSTNPIQSKAVNSVIEDLIFAFGEFLKKKQPVIEDLDTIRDGAAKGATALQEHQSLKTINGESIIGEGDITIEGGGDLSEYATEEYVNNAVEAVNVKGEGGYVYSNGEKVDMRFTRSLIPVGTSIPAGANLNTVAYVKVGKYYCSLNADAKTITNCPTSSAFMMEVFSPLSTVVDNEVDSTYVYRIRILTEYSTGIQYIQYCTVGSTVNNWTYDAWYVCPRTKFTLNSSKNDGSAAIGSKTQGVYVDSTGTLQKMTYSLNKTVPSNAVFTDTNTKVTAVGNHYAPEEDESVAIEAPEGEVVIGVKRDAAGHVVGVMSTPVSGGGGGGGIAVETDPIFSASPAASITDEKMAEWDNKVDAGDINNLKPLITDFSIADIMAYVDRGTNFNYNSDSIINALQNKQPIYIPYENDGLEGYYAAYGFVDDYIYLDVLFGEFLYYIELNYAGGGGIANIDVRNLDDFATEDDLSSAIETYIADFTMESLREGINGGTDVVCDVQGLVNAMNANKVILVRESEDSSYKGVYVLNGYAEDFLYFSITDGNGDIYYCDGADYISWSVINVQSLRFRSWGDKQDRLQSGTNIKTINGESILGSGDITISGGGGASGSAQLPVNYISSNVTQLYTIPSGKVTIFSTPQTEGVKMLLSTVDMDPNKDNAWVIRLSIGADNTGAYMVGTDDNSSIKWANGIAPTFENGKTYELSFRKIGSYFLGVWASFE